MFTDVPARRYGHLNPIDAVYTVADEAPVAVAYNGVPHLVLMATPSDLEDLARGFSITDGICGRADIRHVAIDSTGAGYGIDVRLAPAAFEFFLKNRSIRQQRSYTSCGVCGMETLGELPRLGDGQVPSRTVFGMRGIETALRMLPERQTLNRLTGAMHAAAWAIPDGALTVVREDVGRHNALDKLIGALAVPQPGFCLITSRCSYEMVHKAAAAGFEMLVAISAPTSLAISEARRLGLTLVALARADTQTAYAGAHRLRGVEGAMEATP